MESDTATERVESESPMDKELAKNGQIIICTGDDEENSKNPVTVSVVATERPEDKEEDKNVETIIGAGDGNIENSKKPVIVAVVTTETPKAKNDESIIAALVASATAEVASITISPEKKVESLPQEINSVKNGKKKILKKEVQVSNSKKPFVYYLNRAKRSINEFNEVELCGLGMAIPTVVTIAEILKRNGFAIQKGIMTSTVLSNQEDRKGRQIEKAKIEIVLRKAEKLDVINRVETPKKSADLDDAWN